MKKVYFLLIFINSFTLLAQAPSIDWQKTLGGDNVDILYSINQTSDGGFIIGGSSGSEISGDKTVVNNGNTSSDYWIIKTDALGEIEWQKSIGGYSAEDYTTIIQTADGGYIIGGNSYSNISGDKTENSFGQNDYWIVKLDSLGNILWDRTLGGDRYETFSAIIETPDGGFLIGGTSDSAISGNKTENYIGYQPFTTGAPDYWIVKLDSIGVIQWQNTIGGTGVDALFDMINTTDGNFLIGGRSDSSVSGDKTENSRGNIDYWVLKLDTIGNILWQKTIGGNQADSIYALCNTNDNGYLLGGTSNSGISGDKTNDVIGDIAGSSDMWVLKINDLGETIWQKTIGGAGVDFLYTIVKDNQGNFLLGGSSDSNISYNKTETSRGGIDFWVLKISNQGDVLWDKTLGGAQNETIYGMCHVVNDDSFIFGGSSLSSNTGDKTEVSRGLNDYWIVKLAPESLASHNFNTASISIYPNPTNDNVHITFPQVYKKIDVTIVNIIGEVIQKETDSNTSKIDIDLKGSNGIYFLKLTNENNENTTLKVLKE